MTKPEDDELLHRALDGALTPAEAEGLRRRLAEEPALRERADALRRVSEAVDGLGPAVSPAGFVDRVMDAVAVSAPARPARSRRFAASAAAVGHQLLGWFGHHSEQDNSSRDLSRWTTGMAGGGAIVAKKALWAVAGLAVIVILAVVYFNGTRSVDQGAQGTIGAADRYRGAQPAGVNAKADPVQTFLQSDTFDKIVKDKNMRGILENAEYCSVLAAMAGTKALDGADIETALQDQAALAMFKNASVQRAVSDDGALAALQDVTVQEALRNEVNLKLALDDAVEAAIHNAIAGKALQNPTAVAAAMAKANVAKAGAARASISDSADVEAALNDKTAKALLGNARLQEALAHSGSAALVAYMAKSGVFAAMMADDAFAEAAIQAAKLQAELGSNAKAGIQQKQLQANAAKAGVQANVAKAQLGPQSALNFMKLITASNLLGAMSLNKGVASVMGSDAFEASIQSGMMKAFLSADGAEASLRGEGMKQLHSALAARAQ